MKKILFVLLLAMVGTVNAGDLPRFLERAHDDEYRVTCWRNVSGGGLSCIPDRMLGPGFESHDEEQHESRPASSPELHAHEERVWL